MELYEREVLITKAKELMKEHQYNPLLAIKEAEKILNKQKKKEYEGE